MNRSSLVPLLGAAALLPAAAQAQQKPTQRFTLQAGVSQPLNKATKTATQDTGLSLGLGVVLPTANATGIFSIDATHNRAAGNGNTLQTTGLYLTERLAAHGSTAGIGETGLYYGAGIGIAQARYRAASLEVGETATPGSKSRTALSLRLLAGLQLPGGVLVEAGYTLNPAVTVGAAKVKTDTLSLTLGKSF